MDDDKRTGLEQLAELAAIPDVKVFRDGFRAHDASSFHPTVARNQEFHRASHQWTATACRMGWVRRCGRMK
jgi:hypothetical protein